MYIAIKKSDLNFYSSLAPTYHQTRVPPVMLRGPVLMSAPASSVFGMVEVVDGVIDASIPLFCPMTDFAVDETDGSC